MSDKTQSYATHPNNKTIWHITSLFFILHIGFSVRHAWHVGGRWAWWNAIFAFVLFVGFFAARVMALTVQDRVIRLEMRLRLRELLPAARHGDIAKLTRGQLVALRFASDAELPALMDRCLAGEFAKGDDIKRAVKEWQADWLRA